MHGYSICRPVAWVVLRSRDKLIFVVTGTDKECLQYAFAQPARMNRFHCAVQLYSALYSKKCNSICCKPGFRTTHHQGQKYSLNYEVVLILKHSTTYSCNFWSSNKWSYIILGDLLSGVVLRWGSIVIIILKLICCQHGHTMERSDIKNGMVFKHGLY